MPDDAEFPKKKKRKKKAKLPIDKEPSLFDTPPDHLKGIVRAPDYKTSIAAGDRAARNGARLRNEILEAFRQHGQLTDGDLEVLPELQWVSASNSIRRTRTSLLQAGLIEPTTDKRGHPDRPRSMMTVWRVK